MKPSAFGALSFRALLAAGLAALLALTVAACGGSGTTPVSGVQLRPLSPEFTTRKAVAYSPYRTAVDVSGLAGEVIPAANIKQDLDLLIAAGFGLIRLFDSSDKVAKATLQVIATNKLNMKVQLGAFIQNGDSAFNEAETNRTVALANQFSDIVLAVSIGNETLVSWSFNKLDPAVLAGYITKVRSRISQPITTDDNYAFWAAAPTTITDVIDFVSLHTYVELDTYFDPGKWDWQQQAVPADRRAKAMMDAALDASKGQYDAARNYLDRKGLTAIPITIGETGWNAVDLGRLPFRAHPVNQKMYFDRLTEWARQGASGAGPKAVFYFEAFDEAWKQGDDKWGLFNAKREARYVIRGLFADGTVLGSATWKWEAGSYKDTDAVYFAPPTATSPITQNRYTIYSDAALGSSELRPTDLRFDPFDGNSVLAPEASAAPLSGDGSKYIEITPQPKSYGWGFLSQSSATPATSANLSNFAASGVVHFLVKTTYPGKIEVGISSDSAERVTQEAYLQIANGQYGYCNTGVWCEVNIPLSAFKAANPKLDLAYVLSRFIIADRYSFTGNAANVTTKIDIDAVYWNR